MTVNDRDNAHLRVVEVPLRDKPGTEWSWQIRDHDAEPACCGTVKAGFALTQTAAVARGERALSRYKAGRNG